MAASAFDHAHLAGLFDAGEVARLFSASADIRAMLLVEGALAEAQGAAGVIPETAAAAIKRAALEVQIDPGALADATAQNGVCVPALVSQFRTAMNAPEHAQFIHWGATSQDIIDTGQMLRLRQACELIVKDTHAVLDVLATLAAAHAQTPMAARTYGQQAAPTTFGAVVATWGWPVITARNFLRDLAFPVSLSGAVGTGSALGPDPAQLREHMAGALKLGDPGRSWHTDRRPVLAIAEACVTLQSALGKLGQDLVAMSQPELAEISIGGAGASSTMPQKQNPVGASLLVALAQMSTGLQSVLNAAAVHRFQRDGASWFTEWMALPQVVMGAATSARTAASLLSGLSANADNLARPLLGDGLLWSEALSFELARRMPRPEAQARVKELAGKVRDTGTPLPDLAFAQFPDLPRTVFDISGSTGTAVADANAFVSEVRDT